MSDAPREPDPRATIESFAELADDWNSYGAPPIHSEAIERALAVVELLRTAPWPVPTVAGGVQLEWHRDGWDLELEIAPDGAIEGFVLRMDEDGPAEPSDPNTDVSTGEGS